MNFDKWIHEAYREPEITNFSISNMEVAYQAGLEEGWKREAKPIAYPDADLSSGLSMTDMLICGDVKSINKVVQALHSHFETVPGLRAEIKSLRDQLERLEK